MPTRDFLPVPRHATQEVVLWPWHLGHKVFVGISPPVFGIYLRCNSSGSLAILAVIRRALKGPHSGPRVASISRPGGLPALTKSF
jgi:hypothetical protein